MQISRAPGAEKMASLVSDNPAIAAQLAAPLPAAEVAARIHDLGVAVPEALHDLYRICDGTLHADNQIEATRILGDAGVILLSLQEVVRWKSFWDDLARGYAVMSEAERAYAFHHAFWHPAWIPLAMGIEDVYALATEPCFGGPAQQVVRFDCDGGTCWTIVSDSLDDFLALLADVLAGGARSLDRDTLLGLNPRARYVELYPGEVGPERFERRATLVADEFSVANAPRPTLATAIDEVSAARGAERQTLVASVVAAVQAAAQGVFGEQRRLEASFEEETGEISMYMGATVVEHVTRPGGEMSLEDARTLLDPDAVVGDEFFFQIHYLDGQAECARMMERSYGVALALDASYVSALARWATLYPEVVADALSLG